MIGVLVLLNEWFHDLSVAVFTCALLGAGAVWRAAPGVDRAALPLLVALDRLAWRVAGASFGGVVLFGAIRAVHFREYEWLPSVGAGLLPALAVKHVVLTALLVVAAAGASRARRRGRAALGLS